MFFFRFISYFTGVVLITVNILLLVLCSLLLICVLALCLRVACYYFVLFSVWVHGHKTQLSVPCVNSGRGVVPINIPLKIIYDFLQ